MANEEKKKGIPAHEMVIKLLTDSPKHHLELYLLVFIKMYSLGTIIPPRAIPDLINTFQKAFERADESTQSDLQDRFDEVIQELQKQLTDTFKEVTAIDGRVFKIDPSDEACRKFGFKANQKIVDPDGEPGIIVGVAPMPESSSCVKLGDKTLWVALGKNGGRVCFFPNPVTDLRKGLNEAYYPA